MFERLISSENLALYRDKKQPLQFRFGEYLEVQQAIGPTLKRYYTAANRNENVHTETARMLGFALSVGEVGLGLTDEFLPTIVKDDKYEVRMGGLKQMRTAMTTMFVGAETSLSEQGFYTAADKSLLLDSMAATLPAMKRAFPPGYVAELRGKLEAQRAAFPGKHDRKNIDAMIATLKP